MGFIECLKYWADFATPFAVIVTAGFIFWQARTQRKSHGLDGKRLQRESLSFVFETLHDEAFRNARNKMLKHLNTDRALPESRAEKDSFRVVLNAYEKLGLAVKFGAIDEAVWREYWRTTMLRDWERLEEFVGSERSQSGSDKLFIDAENVVKKWKKNG